MQYFTLSNNITIPVTGSGTNSFAKVNKEYTGDTKEVRSAVKAGYRFFDTAEGYRNEEAIGKGIAESGIDRKEFFLCTKMSKREERPMNREDVQEALQRSLQKLHTNYIDLYLLHFPREDMEETAELWKGFEEAYTKGCVRSVGICNFNREQLSYLLDHCVIPPMVLQVKCNPEEWNTEVIRYAKVHGILPMAWGPLRFGPEYREPLTAIGAKYGKTWAQVILRYHYQNGVITIPKSHSYEHQVQNLDIFDFELNDQEMKQIAEL